MGSFFKLAPDQTDDREHVPGTEVTGGLRRGAGGSLQHLEHHEPEDEGGERGALPVILSRSQHSAGGRRAAPQSDLDRKDRLAE